MKKIALHSLKDTERLAKLVASTLRGGDVIALSGPLGAGKTTFTQALGRALGIKRDVKSPTFIVMHTHRLPKTMTTKHKARTLCHVDAYRINDLAELAAIGLYDYLGNPDVITVIEWAEKIQKALPEKNIRIAFSFAKNKRTVLLSK